MNKKATILACIVFIMLGFGAWLQFASKKPWEYMDTSAQWDSMTGFCMKKGESTDLEVSLEKVEKMKAYIEECSFKRKSGSKEVMGGNGGCTYCHCSFCWREELGNLCLWLKPHPDHERGQGVAMDCQDRRV